jgi:hypothetical protein
MKHLSSLFLALVLSMSAFALEQINIHFSHVTAGDYAGLNQDLSSLDGYDFNVTRLQYYISQIHIVHDGGMETLVPDTWLLVTMGEDVTYDLGEFDVTDIEGIRFSVGVEASVNHLDPAAYPADHPLAPQAPSMHWGWASGYRFVCLEGISGASMSDIYQIHALGDGNYQSTSLTGEAVMEGGEYTFYIHTDIQQAVKDIDVSAGLIEHSESAEAADLLDNFADFVFTIGDAKVSGEGGVSAIESPSVSLFSLAPNPVIVGTPLQIRYDFVGAAANLEVYDAQGRLVQRDLVQSGSSRLELEESGMYMVRLVRDGQLLAQEQLVVSR